MPNKSVLFRLRHCHHLEFYLQTINGNVLNDSLEFKDTRNLISLADPLIDQLFSVKGCKLSCLEVMMKYYKADVKAQRRITTNLEKKIPDSVEQTVAEETNVMNSYISLSLNEEISESRLY